MKISWKVKLCHPVFTWHHLPWAEWWLLFSVRYVLLTLYLCFCSHSLSTSPSTQSCLLHRPSRRGSTSLSGELRSTSYEVVFLRVCYSFFLFSLLWTQTYLLPMSWFWSLVKGLEERNRPRSIMLVWGDVFDLFILFCRQHSQAFNPVSRPPPTVLWLKGLKIHLTTAEPVQDAQTHHLERNWIFSPTPLRIVIPDIAVYLFFPKIVCGENLLFLVPVGVLWKESNSFLCLCLFVTFIIIWFLSHQALV